MPHIGTERGRKLIESIIAARHDMLELANQHKLRPEDLAVWISDPANQRVLSGLCLLADLQTQILLSRYRLLAASRLIKLATMDAESKESGEVSRRACIDLLRLELKRADLDTGESEEAEQGPESVRKLLYGDEGGKSEEAA